MINTMSEIAYPRIATVKKKQVWGILTGNDQNKSTSNAIENEKRVFGKSFQK
jgi:hypothetical protein